MTEILSYLHEILAGLAIGVAIGLLFFGGLWWTTQRLVTSLHPARLMLVSFAARMTVLGFGLYGASRLGAVAVIAAGVAVLVVRTLAVIRVHRRSARTS